MIPFVILLVVIDCHQSVLVIEIDDVDVPMCNNATNKKFLFNRGHYKSINTDFLKVDHVFFSKSLEECVDYFYRTVELL